MDDKERQRKAELLDIAKRRFHELQKQATFLGINAPAAIKMEIEDHEAKIAQLTEQLESSFTNERISPPTSLELERINERLREIGDILLPRRQGPPRWLLPILIITLLVGAVVVYILFVRNSPFRYAVEVRDQETGQLIEHAQVILSVSSREPIDQFTDTSGFTSFNLDPPYAGQLSLLQVKATGYEALSRNVTLTDNGRQRIELKPIHSTPTPTPPIGTPTPSLTSTPKPPLTIADFRDCIGRTELGGITGPAFDSPDRLQDKYTPESAGGCSARLEYDVSKDWAEFYLKLADTSLTNYDTLCLDIRVDPDSRSIPTQVKVELKRSNNTEMAAYYISGISKQWQTICVPFAEFRPSLSSYTDMSEIGFTFEAKYAGRGVVYVDNVRATGR